MKKLDEGAPTGLRLASGWPRMGWICWRRWWRPRIRGTKPDCSIRPAGKSTRRDRADGGRLDEGGGQSV